MYINVKYNLRYRERTFLVLELSSTNTAIHLKTNSQYDVIILHLHLKNMYLS